MSQPLAIELVDVSKRFGPRWAVARLTFQLPAGRSLLLTGHNGSGKTTLLRMISTATFPTAGDIRLFGQETRAHRNQLRPGVALLSHASFLYEDLTASQNLRLLTGLLGIDDATTHIDQTLERVGLSSRKAHPVREFSAGMRKRLALARLLLKKPKLALFDEPFGELDPGGIRDLEQLMAELKASGTTIVLATHQIEQGRSLTDVRLHLEGGRLTEVT